MSEPTTTGEARKQPISANDELTASELDWSEEDWSAQEYHVFEYPGDALAEIFGNIDEEGQ